ncbi:MAG TPA: CdaR family protein [bacterium]|nr:CdaR family protein [bacterium]
MKRFLDERTLYLLLSGAIAVVMWLYVATAQNPLVSRSMKVDIQLHNLDPNEVVMRPSARTPLQATIRVQGPRSQVALLTPKLVDAYADLSGLGPGDHPEVPVIITPPPDVRVADQRPASILVVLDALASKRLPIEVSLLAAPPEGITLGAAHTAPSVVVVNGPSRQVAQVRHALVYFDTAAVRQQVVASLQVAPVDATGQAVTGVKVTPSNVNMTLAVREAVISKVVPVVPTLVGTPQPALAVTSATTVPGIVTLTGPSAALTGVENAATAPVDVTGAHGDLVRRVALQLPAAVSASTRQVTVTVRVGRGLLSTVLRGVAVRVIGVPAGGAFRVMPDRVDVQVEGPQDLVRGLTAQSVTAEISAAGRGPGQYTISPRAVLPPGIRVLTVQPAQVVVILSSL